MDLRTQNQNKYSEEGQVLSELVHRYNERADRMGTGILQRLLRAQMYFTKHLNWTGRIACCSRSKYARIYPIIIHVKDALNYTNQLIKGLYYIIKKDKFFPLIPSIFLLMHSFTHMLSYFHPSMQEQSMRKSVKFVIVKSKTYTYE